MNEPRFVRISATVMPDPRWKPEQGRKGAIKPAHPCIIVLGLVDEEGGAWTWTEISGFQRHYATSK